MTLNPQEKKDLSEIRMKKAGEFIEDARINHEGKRFRTSVNRSYYAVLNAVRALLIMDGVNPETHDGLITMLSLRFIKTKILPASLVKDFKLLLSRRTDVDYGDFDSVEADDSRDALEKAENIINQISDVLEKI
ncbi:MAG TPA: HEPN domain-containing protein [Spirochaetota bacterium]|nr:HEPN domain-containing protein [Spirochaetota bacterium]HPI88895.1 HEPN domain-containing protein [Spirochaetota bacterium]HPR46975.1 HEPN domain-containing protein [Spirochaetota bacterium]